MDAALIERGQTLEKGSQAQKLAGELALKETVTDAEIGKLYSLVVEQIQAETAAQPTSDQMAEQAAEATTPTVADLIEVFHAGVDGKRHISDSLQDSHIVDPTLEAFTAGMERRKYTPDHPAPETNATDITLPTAEDMPGDQHTPKEEQHSQSTDAQTDELLDIFQAGMDGERYVPKAQKVASNMRNVITTVTVEDNPKMRERNERHVTRVDNFEGEQYNNDGEDGNHFDKLKRMTQRKDYSDIHISGARIIDPESERAVQFAKLYYSEIRFRKTDCFRIAQNIGVDESTIEKVKRYLFVDNSLYDEDLQEWRRFDADCAIAHSWQRLIDGRDIQMHDRILIDHEIYEMHLKEMYPNLSHQEAHARAQEKFNYRKAADEYYGNLNKHKKD